MKKINPRTYRLRPDQEVWLQEQADKKGHGMKVLVLRQLIDRAMRDSQRRSASAA